ncbi:MAG: hypothetical protein ED559_05990 [Phycisphaera sp.]|nr:MAG: hypothetical protein ED559_05990 [Phycisphaera sp.]
MTTRKRSGRGTVYLLVLMSSVIVTLIGLMGFRMLRAQAAIAQSDADRDEALMIAESAVQWGVHIVTLKDDWRDSITSGVPIRTGAFGQGTMSVTITDKDDGDLSDDEAEEFVISGTGVVGDARQTLEVTVATVGGPHPSLEKSITVGDRLALDTGASLTIESGGTARRLTTYSGMSFSSSKVAIEDPVDLPDPMLITEWMAKGTLIDSSMHTGSYNGQTFSDVSAPSKVPVDPNGIYTIDAGGKGLILSNCTVQGTLIVTNLGLNTVHFHQSKLVFGDHGGPTLLVDGDLILDTGWGVGVHQGLIYANGDIRISADFMMVGAMFSTDDVWIDPVFVSINDHPGATSGPPDGFTQAEGYEVVAGSWERVVN